MSGAEDVFELLGDDRQRAVAAQGLARCTYPWRTLSAGLWSSVNRTRIPVEWQDLSRYAAALEGSAHRHVHENGDVGHPLEARAQVLGLAWYSGKVSLDLTLVEEPEFAHEVLLAEGAHMVDFFWMTPDDRRRIFAAFHGGDEAPHDHGWFEETGNHDYWSWVGEAFMAGFCLAYSDVAPTFGGFDHAADQTVAEAIRQTLKPPYFSKVGSTVFHDSHRGQAVDHGWRTYDQAKASGRRPCGVCKPTP